MIGILEQFEIAARELDALNAEISGKPATETSAWLQRAQAAVNQAEDLLKARGESMVHYNFCQEIKHHRLALLQLKKAMDKGQRPMARSSPLRREMPRPNRVPNWAPTVEDLT